jgi:hypothetical protein
LHIASEYTLHNEPSPAHPSHRLLTALRLVHAQIPASALQRYIDAPYDKQKHTDLQAWLDILTGFTDRISDENEDTVYADLRSICRTMLEKAQKSLLALRSLQYPGSGQHVADAKRMVEQLWKNDCKILQGVIDSIDEDVIF